VRANAVYGLIVAALVFIPLERAFALRKGQKVLREGWRTDLAHFLFTRALSDLCAVVTLGVLIVLLRRLLSPQLHAAVASQPAPLQFVEAVVIANLGAYLGHRLSHRVPLLWRFHAVHHSSERMDWLAAARVHPLDQLVSKGLILVPLYLLGFSRETFGAYVALATFHAVLVHANVRLDLGPLRYVIATPAYHHWHHSDDPRARDKNFAGELPVIDWLFGTLYMPRDESPQGYGTTEAVPRGYLMQLLYPFRRR
jgi:sterol desaturase/sphingolipid hydroxylase (fatty acid hydroxylase superfamily)